MAMAAASPLRAQEHSAVEPTGSIAVDASGLLTFASSGDYLIVANGRQLELYDVRDPAQPRDVVTMSLDTPLLALTATVDYALAAVGNSGTTDNILVIAPDKYSRGGFGIVNILDVPAGTRQLVLSPDNHWALALGDQSYVTMALSAADDIQISAPFASDTAPLIGAALTNDTALLIRQGAKQVAAVPLDTSNQSQPQTSTLALDSDPVAVTLSEDGSLAAVSLNDRRIVLFDPASMKSLKTVSLEDGPVTELRFLEAGEQRILVMKIDGRPALMLLDVTRLDPSPLPESLVVDQSARALATSGLALAVSDAQGIRLFRLGAENS